MWVYVQSSGGLLRKAAGDAPATPFARCYSGYGPGKNTPDCETEIGVGPIPRGFYTIGAPRCVDKPGPNGPYVLPLEPDALNEMHGRAGFLVHGDSKAHPGQASHGCIIPLATLAGMETVPPGVTGRRLRQLIWESGDHRLHVVRDPADALISTPGP